MMHERQGPTVRLPVHKVRPDSSSLNDDVVASEEPLEIRLQWDDDGAVARKSLAVTMRTPGRDLELAAGFLFGEGVVKTREDIVDISHCTDLDERQAYNIVTVTLRPGLTFDESRLERHFYTTSSCGVCGKAALEALEIRGCSALPEGLEVRETVVRRIPAALRDAQAVLDQTGGFMLQACSIRTDGYCVCKRTLAGTTRWTSSSANSY